MGYIRFLTKQHGKCFWLMVTASFCFFMLMYAAYSEDPEEEDVFGDATMSNPTFTFVMTRAQLEEARTKLASEGVNLVGDKGDVTHLGVVLHYVFTEPNLTITQTHKPYLIPQSTVDNAVNGWFKEEVAI